MPLAANVTILSSRILDPYILVGCSDHSLILLHAMVHQGVMKLVEVENANLSGVWFLSIVFDSVYLFPILLRFCYFSDH
jgi:hypothetical protein